MPIEITGYRVFIASPGGLQEERTTFRNVIAAFNEAHAIPKGAMFLPVGWEDTPGGMGRAQRRINAEIEGCDYLVLLLWDWWGTPPSTHSRYTSGTEEEFYLATSCVKDPTLHMRDVVVLFKALEPKQQIDPGPQIASILKFKKKLEDEKEHFYETFDNIQRFHLLLDRHLGEWLRVHEGVAPVAVSHRAQESHTGGNVQGEAPSGQAVLNEAWRLADGGRRTEAEALFAKETVNGESARAFLEYGRFLRLDGRLEQAMTMVTKALELAQSHREEANVAGARYEMGLLHESRGELPKAQELYEAALRMNEELERDEAIADCLRSIGVLFAIRGELEAAEERYQRALVIDERLKRLDGMADDYSSIGSARHARGDYAGAEEMHQKALAIDDALQRREAVAKHYVDLGEVRYARGDLDGAEAMYRKAVAIDEQLGRIEELVDDYSSLGTVLYSRGDLDGAEQMHRRALETNERLERRSGLSDHYDNLALVYQARGDVETAAELTEKARIIREPSESV